MNHLQRITHPVLPLQKQLVPHPIEDSMKSISDRYEPSSLLSQVPVRS